MCFHIWISEINCFYINKFSFNKPDINVLIVATNFIFANLCWPKYFWGKLRNFEYFLEKLRNFEYFLGKLRNFEYFSRALVYPRIKKAAKKSNHTKVRTITTIFLIFIMKKYVSCIFRSKMSAFFSFRQIKLHLYIYFF